MKYQSKDLYGAWDSPHTFCRHQLDDEEDGLVCTSRIFDGIEDYKEDLDSKCPFTEQTASKCKLFKFHKHDKNLNAKRYKEKS